ncbi:hypothetical protein XFLM_05460 [Xylella fastidiosa subsp. fastidiosa GB514]|nr:hypothetical protein XFLM_05460 [Xylella fastidiosa subsp. fastidiosa GB514]KAF0571012.1 hypothetical protein P305_07030 [Xylella fastidiosa subsp. fastidiosa Mus-1]
MNGDTTQLCIGQNAKDVMLQVSKNLIDGEVAIRG